MEREIKLILDTLDLIKHTQALMMDVQHDHHQEIERLKIQIEQNKSELKQYRDNGYEWKE